MTPTAEAHALEAGDVLGALAVPDDGLSSDEATRRLAAGADEPIISAHELRIDESALPGESLRVSEAPPRDRVGRPRANYVDPSVGARVASQRDQPPGGPDGLSHREADVLERIVLGETNERLRPPSRQRPHG